MIYRIAIIFLFAALFPLQSFARDYHVDVIIFTNTVGANTKTVTWDEKAPRNIRAQNKLDILYRQAVEATKVREEAATNPGSSEPSDGSTIKEARIKTVVSSGLVELLDIRNELQQSPDHEILQTLSWNQSEADYKSSPLINTATPNMKGVIRIYAPNLLFAELNLTYVPDGILEGNLIENGAANINSVAVEANYSTVRYGSDYGTQAVIEPVRTRYFIDEQRKLKLNEIHYFDHPRFGVILSVKPIEEPTPQSS